MCAAHVQAELSFLAHHLFQLDKFRAETCCVVGNYHSLRTEHEKAVIYFRRALQLDRKYVSLQVSITASLWWDRSD